MKKVSFIIGIILLAVFFLPSVFFGLDGGERFSGETCSSCFSIVDYIVSFVFAFLATVISFFIVYGLKGRETGLFPSFCGLFRSDRPVWWVMGVFGYCLVAALAGGLLHAVFLSRESMSEWARLAEIAPFVTGWACACFLCALVQRKRWRAVLNQKD